MSVQKPIIIKCELLIIAIMLGAFIVIGNYGYLRWKWCDFISTHQLLIWMIINAVLFGLYPILYISEAGRSPAMARVACIFLISSSIAYGLGYFLYTIFHPQENRGTLLGALIWGFFIPGSVAGVVSLCLVLGVLRFWQRQIR